MPYTEKITSLGTLMTIDEFHQDCRDGLLIDYDGHGRIARNGKIDPKFRVYPSLRLNIPTTATHVVWYNR